jgi:hypothetical protein
MLLDDLLEARVVQLRELGEVVYIGNDVAQILLQQIKVLLDRVAVLAGRLLLCASDGIVDFLLRGCYATDDLFALNALEGVDLVELLLQLLDKVLFRLLVPYVVDTQRVFQALIVDVVEDPILVERLLQLLTESARSC